MAPDKPSIVTTYSHEGKRYPFYIFEVTKYIFEVTKYIFEVTKYIFEVTGTFRKYLYISELQRPPNSNILLAYLCIYVVRLLYTKAKEKEKGFGAFLFLLLNHTKHTAEHSGKQITLRVIRRGTHFFNGLLISPNPLPPHYIDAELFGNVGFPLVRFKRLIST